MKTTYEYLEAIYTLEKQHREITQEINGLKSDLHAMMRAWGAEAISAGEYTAVSITTDIVVRKIHAGIDTGITAEGSETPES